MNVELSSAFFFFFTLTDLTLRIRDMMAVSMSIIVQCVDWIECTNQTCMQCCFYPEFTREVTDTQMPLVAPVILPEMYKIFTMAEVLEQHY